MRLLQLRIIRFPLRVLTPLLSPFLLTSVGPQGTLPPCSRQDPLPARFDSCAVSNPGYCHTSQAAFKGKVSRLQEIDSIFEVEQLGPAENPQILSLESTAKAEVQFPEATGQDRGG